MTRLVQSSVVFNEADHTYTTQDGRSLSGVTALITRQLFAHKYDNIPKFVLDRAADYGTGVHRRIQLCDSLGVVPADDPVVEAYNRMKEEMGLIPLANEYLVSDNLNVASSIDVVYEDYTLCDIKTTSKLDMDYLSWQLSLYAYLFELQNPGLRVPRLLAAWLPKKQYGRPEMREVNRIATEECARLIDIDSKGGGYLTDAVAAAGCFEGGLSVKSEVINAVVMFERQIKALTEQRDEMKAGLLRLMCEKGVSSWKSPDGQLTLSIRKGGVTKRLDTASMKKDNPDIYNKYLKDCETSDSLIMKVS